MTQSINSIPNSTRTQFRTNLNNALTAMSCDFYGPTDPATITGMVVYPCFRWGDSVNNILKIRNLANSGWINFIDLTTGNILTNAATATTGPSTSIGFSYLLNEAPNSGTALERNESNSDNGSWITVGPTGSGAALIWTALNSLPAGVKSIKLGFVAESIHSSAPNGANYIQAYVRKNGSSVVPDRWVVNAYTYLSNDTEYDITTAECQVDTNKIFQLLWNKLITGSAYIRIYLNGYTL